MKFDLSKLDKYTTSYKPSDFDSIIYLFWEKGIGYEKLFGYEKVTKHSFTIPLINYTVNWESITVVEGYPMPYIIGILNTFDYVKKEEEKAYKKANKKR